MFVGAFAIAAVAGAAPQHGIQTGDLDTTTDPCSDFFQYANGAWRASHPIPAYMNRWSRRWESGELNKDHLREILEQVSSKQSWPTGSAEQLIGDYYAACMDQAQIDKLGAAPVRPMLLEIEGIKSPAELGKMIGRFHDVGIPVPFAVNSASDNHDPTHVIADVLASGLGMPDRD